MGVVLNAAMNKTTIMVGEQLLGRQVLLPTVCDLFFNYMKELCSCELGGGGGGGRAMHRNP